MRQKKYLKSCGKLLPKIYISHKTKRWWNETSFYKCLLFHFPIPSIYLKFFRLESPRSNFQFLASTIFIVPIIESRASCCNGSRRTIGRMLAAKLAGFASRLKSHERTPRKEQSPATARNLRGTRRFKAIIQIIRCREKGCAVRGGAVTAARHVISSANSLNILRFNGGKMAR